MFDSLSEMRLLAQSSLRYRRQILALKQFFVGRQCTVLLLDDRTAEGPDLQLQSIAHGVVSLEQQVAGLWRRHGASCRWSSSAAATSAAAITTSRSVAAAWACSRGWSPPSISPTSSATPIASGVAALDTLLGGGIDRGTSTL